MSSFKYLNQLMSKHLFDILEILRQDCSDAVPCALQEAKSVTSLKLFPWAASKATAVLEIRSWLQL